RWLTPVIPAFWEAETGRQLETLVSRKKKVAMPWDQNPEQSHRNYSEHERKRKQKWREEERGGQGTGKEKEEEIEKELEEEQKEEKKKEKENEEQHPRKRLVSKPLMDTLWGKFKLNKYLTIQDSFSLSFEFSMTHKQINQWFCKKRKKYNKAMSEQKYNKSLRGKQNRTLRAYCKHQGRTPLQTLNATCLQL
ncbi:NANOG neighbor homeobox, partial [Otolemur garnettii]|uniref:NANOG neighbor homeobox n=1 Tax=Otolemur garnettii TaxID=30611 RepID=UPI000643F76E